MLTEVQISPEAFAGEGGGGGELEPKEAPLRWGEGRRRRRRGEEGNGGAVGDADDRVPAAGFSAGAVPAVARMGPSPPAPLRRRPAAAHGAGLA